MRLNALMFLRGAESLFKFDRICTAISDSLYSKYVAPCTISSIVLRSLSIELAMKSIFMFFHEKKFDNVHDLHKLFSNLGPASDELVKRCQSRLNISKADIKALLTIHKNIFVEARYLSPLKDFYIPSEDHKFLIILSEESVSLAQEMFENAKINGEFLKDILKSKQRELTPEQQEQLIKRMSGSSVRLDR